jgi:hypothetical protein
VHPKGRHRRCGVGSDRDGNHAGVVLVVGFGQQVLGVQEDPEVVLAGRDVGRVDPLAVEVALVDVAAAGLDALVRAVVLADAAPADAVPLAVGVVHARSCLRRVGIRHQIFDAERPLLAALDDGGAAADAELVAREALEVEVLVARAVDEARIVGRRRAEEEVGRPAVERQHAEAEELSRARSVDALVGRLQRAVVRQDRLELLARIVGERRRVDDEVGETLRPRGTSQQEAESQKRLHRHVVRSGSTGRRSRAVMRRCQAGKIVRIQ